MNKPGSRQPGGNSISKSIRIGAVIVSLLILAHFVAFAAWFAPLAGAIVVASHLRPQFRRCVPLIGLGLLLSGLWATLLLHYGNYLPNPVKVFLAIPLQPEPGMPAASRFDPGPWCEADLIGYTYLGSVVGALLLLYWGSLEVTGRMSPKREIRVWSFRVTVLLFTTIGTWVLWWLRTGFEVLFGFVAYFFLIGAVTSITDPLDELRD